MSGVQDYKLFALRLRLAVERSEKAKLKNGNGKNSLPRFPRVEARGNDIIIIRMNGDEEHYETAESPMVAIALAEEIQRGLRVIDYVKLNLVNYLAKLSDDLRELNIPDEIIDETIYEGYKSLKKWFIDLAV